jgi:hypothetical protein
MVHVPAAIPVTVEPLTVQIAGVLLLNVTAKPDEAVALTVPVLPTLKVGAVPKVIVCNKE